MNRKARAMATSTEAVPQPNTQATTTPVTSVLTVVLVLEM